MNVLDPQGKPLGVFGKPVIGTGKIVIEREMLLEHSGAQGECQSGSQGSLGMVRETDRKSGERLLQGGQSA
ncbi:hypothetical protein Q3H58_001291 [Pseudomonas psychrotolerans]|nr:hypothetical protein [Pseudomonas psychrotolerans]